MCCPLFFVLGILALTYFCFDRFLCSSLFQNKGCISEAQGEIGVLPMATAFASDCERGGLISGQKGLAGCFLSSIFPETWKLQNSLWEKKTREGAFLQLVLDTWADVLTLQTQRASSCPESGSLASNVVARLSERIPCGSKVPTRVSNGTAATKWMGFGQGWFLRFSLDGQGIWPKGWYLSGFCFFQTQDHLDGQVLCGS